MSAELATVIAIGAILIIVCIACAVLYSRRADRRDEEIDFTREQGHWPF